MTSPSGIVWRSLAAIVITVVWASALCSPAAATIVYSTGFENGEGLDYFTLANVDGQGGWSDGPAEAPVVIQAGTVQSDYQALQIDCTEWPVNPGEMKIAASRNLSDPTAANPLVTISLGLRITADNEASYGIATYDGSTCTNEVIFELNDPALEDPADIIVNGVSTGQSWSADVGTWVTLEILLDFTHNLANASYEGASIADDVPFLNDGDLTSFAILTDDAWYAVGSSMFVDNLSVTAVPEPGTFVLLLGLCAAAVLRRRRH